MQNNWLSIIPPVIVLLLAFTTRRVILSLLSGIISAALILNNFALYKTLKTVISKIWATSELGSLQSFDAFKNNWSLFICLFLLMLGMVIVLVNHSGGAYAYGNYIKKKLKNQKAVQTSSLTLSLLFFIDDHFSALTVGSVMHSLTDRFNIPRAKIAFLVDSMAAPLCILAPISSWAAYIIMQLKKSGVSSITQQGTYILADPFSVYLKTIPFIFYSIIMIASVWFLVRRNLSVGLMHKHEAIANETGNLFAGKTPTNRTTKELNDKNKSKANMIDFLLPIITLITSIVVSILYTGDFFIFGGTNGFIQAFANSKTATALFMGGSITLCTTIILFMIKKKLYLKDIYPIIKESFSLMGDCIIVLVLAWTFSDLLQNDLLTGQYLASFLIGHLNIIILPLLFFIITAITSSGMGSAWGSMAVIIPIAIPMLTSFLNLKLPVNPQDILILYPTLGAILSGAVSGNHTSPISDTTIMSVASTGCYHMDHVRTQHTYSIPVLFFTGLSFLISGILISYKFDIISTILISLFTGIIGNFIYLKVRNKN